jgi:VWFA-related protein
VIRHACTAAIVATAAITALSAQQDVQRATFRSSADLVSVAVIVRTPDGRLVRNLKARDFEVFDRGAARPIVQFQPGDGADARVAVLVDSSGSMVLGERRERSRRAAEFLTDAFRGRDTASVFSFDSRIRRLTPFTTDRAQVREAVTSVEPYGLTGLYDAIVDTVRVVTDEAPRARAVLLLTDGIDTGSRSSPQEAAAAAAAVDIPLYVLSVAEPDDRSARLFGGRSSTEPDAFTLQDLAWRTGGRAAEATTLSRLRSVTQEIVTELRHQYVLAIPARSERGWHDLTVRVRRGRVQARSRDGYFVS